MSLAVERIERTRIALDNALAEQDWEAIARLDLECRQHVDAAMQEPLDDDSDLKRSLERLLLLYRALVQQVTLQRQGMAEEIIRVNRSHKGAKVYRLFG